MQMRSSSHKGLHPTCVQGCSHAQLLNVYLAPHNQRCVRRRWILIGNLHLHGDHVEPTLVQN
eukprot:364833-Chlamydomonas_euryale.AAC.19